MSGESECSKPEEAEEEHKGVLSEAGPQQPHHNLDL